jgi:tRNA G18 (ribose-2'-O)-methylase SpoU
VAFGLEEDSVALNDYVHNEGKIAVIMGNEDHGISEDVLKACDTTVMIPMQRGVDSLNVAAASAVAFWEIFK